MPILGGPLGHSLAPHIKSSRALSKWLRPVANWYANLMGYRQVGLRYDDLLMEERPDVQRALHRLTPREAYDRAFRIKTATHQSILHDKLPKDKWVKSEDDVRYLRPHVSSVEQENQERAKWDNLTITRH